MVLTHIRRAWDRLFCHKGSLTLGSEAVWTIKPLPQKAVVISGGVGHDISFEKELVSKFSARVYLFDPSPTGKKTMAKSENKHKNIFFYTKGLAGARGDISFVEPKIEQEGSYRKAGEGKTHTFSCIRLSDFLAENNIRHVDLLKLDIEGFEYEVLDDILRHTKIHVDQICVEFHHPHIVRIKTLLMLIRLYAKGYVLFHKHYCDYSLRRLQ